MPVVNITDNGQAYVQDNILGYVGDNRSKVLKIIHPAFDGCEYRILFSVPGGGVYETTLDENGEYLIEGSLLAEAGKCECDFRAVKLSGDEYETVWYSEIFELDILESLNGETEPIPTYEQSESALEKVLAMNTSGPYIGANGNWYVYDSETNEFKDSGVKAQPDMSGYYTKTQSDQRFLINTSVSSGTQTTPYSGWYVYANHPVNGQKGFVSLENFYKYALKDMIARDFKENQSNIDLIEDGSRVEWLTTAAGGLLSGESVVLEVSYSDCARFTCTDVYINFSPKASVWYTPLPTGAKRVTVTLAEDYANGFGIDIVGNPSVRSTPSLSFSNKANDELEAQPPEDGSGKYIRLICAPSGNMDTDTGVYSGTFTVSISKILVEF